jgi:dolichol-phosphate mannosyltransferase
MNDAVVIIPTYNERENVREIARAVLQVAPWIDLLIVDDNSPDGTGQLADALAETDPRIHVLHRQEKQGLGRAYIAGFKWALAHNYEFICEMDADFSHNPADLNKFREAARDADLVLGTRYKGGIRVINWPLQRLILSKGAAVYVRSSPGCRSAIPPAASSASGGRCSRPSSSTASAPTATRSRSR